MECYHYRRVKSGKSTKRKKVVTHRAKEDFIFSDWVDLSDQLYTLFFIETLKVIRLSVKETIEFGAAASKNYEVQKENFISSNRRDKHNDFSVIQRVPGLIKNIGVYSSPKPCYLNLSVLVFLDFIMLGWVQRMIMAERSGKTYFNIKKFIKV